MSIDMLFTGLDSERERSRSIVDKLSSRRGDVGPEASGRWSLDPIMIMPPEMPDDAVSAVEEQLRQIEADALDILSVERQ